jgi:hypothetical protein
MLKLDKTMTSAKVIEMLQEAEYGYEITYEGDTDEVNSISYCPNSKEFNEYENEIYEVEFNEFDLVEEHYQWDEQED